MKYIIYIYINYIYNKKNIIIKNIYNKKKYNIKNIKKLNLII